MNEPMDEHNPDFDTFQDPLLRHAELDDSFDSESMNSEESTESTESSGIVQADSYWSISRMPLTSLVFTLPLVLAYEGGVLLMGRSSPRNGADVWLRQLLDSMGFGAYFLLPTLTILGLLAWHHVEHDRWFFRPHVFFGMLLECLLLAFLLVAVARLQQSLWPVSLELIDTQGATSVHAARPLPHRLPFAERLLTVAVENEPQRGIFSRVVGFCGAGLYEEVLFRLLFLPIFAWILMRIGLRSDGAWMWSCLLTSLLFSTAHYIGPMGDSFDLYSFTFRTVAGIFFSTLFLSRGFGIAAGSHAAYDMIVGFL